MAVTWCSTVFGESTSRRAISALRSPSATSARTCSSRAVRPARPRLRGAPWQAAQALRRQPTGDRGGGATRADGLQPHDDVPRARVVVRRRGQRQGGVVPAAELLPRGRGVLGAARELQHPRPPRVDAGRGWQARAAPPRLELPRHPGGARLARPLQGVRRRRAHRDVVAGQPRALGLRDGHRREPLQLAGRPRERRRLRERVVGIGVAEPQAHQAAHQQRGFVGLASVFRKLNFREIARRTPTRPLMRLQLGEAKRATAGSVQSLRGRPIR